MEVVVKVKDPEGVLPVRVVLCELELSAMEEQAIPQALKLREAPQGLVQLRLGHETLAHGALCLHRGQLAVRISQIADRLPRQSMDCFASFLGSEGD
ncbi:MAG: hypothetical protein ACK6D3_19655 [Planctomycetaceae bacterium]